MDKEFLKQLEKENKELDKQFESIIKNLNLLTLRVFLFGLFLGIALTSLVFLIIKIVSKIVS